MKELSNRLEVYYTRTGFLLEKTNPNLVENQASSAEDNFDPYKKKIAKLVRRISLFEIN